MDPLDALNPLDGRYRNQIENLSSIFSERGLMKYRLKVEGEYLLALSQHPKIEVRMFSEEEKGLVRGLYDLSLDDARIIKSIETDGFDGIKKTNHDVKAVEYYIKYKLKKTSLGDCMGWIHFGLTSEDVNNLSYSLSLSDGLEKIIIPTLDKIIEKIDDFSERYKSLPILTRTHGQPASPSTFGKEFRVFSSRLERQVSQLKDSSILAKLNGATGNYNAHHAAYPDVDWIDFSRNFIESFNENRRIKLSPNFITTQIEPHDTYAELFDNLRRVNSILIDFSQDIWRYI
ncbi:MAG TPA: lyase family protein, partial [Candidatus Nanoarchaeia archaeon]|nr:lyase family protein [Candidatus Nanoarchaeia archaeon]